MGRFAWPLALVVTFFAGLAVAGVAWKASSTTHEVDRLRDTVSRLQQQVSTLQARLRARENATAPRQYGATVSTEAFEEPSSGPGARPGGRIASVQERPSRGRSAAGGDGADAQGGSQADGATSRPGSRATTGPPPTVELALERFYRYLDAANGTEGRERWQKMRELVDDLRAMGDVGAQALMNVLASGSDSDERRAAARLLGQLQVPQSLPVLKNIIEREDDQLLRRAAASALRRLQTPESVPVMEHIVTNPGEDRLVRLSAAYGLAESGRPLGVSGLTQIFDESTTDGRGRDMAFRALASLNDDRSLPFMRQLVTSAAEPGFRLQAIQYLTKQGDRQALAALQLVMQSPNEQPSIRDAAARAHAVISGK
jgi:HEAT repeats